MSTNPKTIDLGKVHFTYEDLLEVDPPQAKKHPKGFLIHVVQCCDCGAHTNTGKADNIEHYATCTPGEADKWEKHYADMPTDEELEAEY